MAKLSDSFVALFTKKIEKTHIFFTERVIYRFLFVTLQNFSHAFFTNSHTLYTYYAL